MVDAGLYGRKSGQGFYTYNQAMWKDNQFSPPKNIYKLAVTAESAKKTEEIDKSGLTQQRFVIATETQCREAIPAYREITSLTLVMT